MSVNSVSVANVTLPTSVELQDSSLLMIQKTRWKALLPLLVIKEVFISTPHPPLNVVAVSPLAPPLSPGVLELGFQLLVLLLLLPLVDAMDAMVDLVFAVVFAVGLPLCQKTKEKEALAKCDTISARIREN